MSQQAATAGRRESILAAALHCFNEQGLEAAAIGEICARAKASVGSVYHHFGSKEGLAAALLAEGLRDNARQLEARLKKARSARQGVRTLVISLVDWIAAHPEWARFIYTVSSGRPAKAHAAALADVNAYYAQVVDGYFAPHAKAGAFRELPAECFASLIAGPAHDYARRWLRGQAAADIRSHAELFANAAWNAVRAPGKG